MKKMFKSYAFNLFLIVSFTSVVLYFTLKDNYDEVIQILKHANPIMLVLVFSLSFAGQCLLGVILKKLTNLSKPDYQFTQGLINALVASFFHGITPSASGGQFAQVYIFRKQGVPISDSASILWMDFILYQATMVGLVAMLMMLRFQTFSNHGGNLYVLVFLGFLINLCVIAGLWAIAHFKRLYTWMTTTGIELAYKIKLIKNREKALDNLNAQLVRFELETKRLKSHKALIFQVVCLNVVRQTLMYSIPFFCALALGVPVEWNQWLDVVALSSFVAMVNCFIPIPGASGGTEATFLIMFSILFTKVQVTSTMILWRFATFYFIMIVGGITFVIQKLQDRKEMES